MEVDRINKNCYNCEGFGYLARNYKRQNWREKKTGI